MPPEFVETDMPSWLHRIYDALFGRNWAIEAVEARLYQLMQMLHATELEEYVVAPDPRVTYIPFETMEWHAVDGLVDIAARGRSMITEDDEDKLFGTEPDEPYKTFRELWKNHDQLPYKLGGLVLAVAYRIEEHRGT